MRTYQTNKYLSDNERRVIINIFILHVEKSWGIPYLKQIESEYTEGYLDVNRFYGEK